MLEIFHACEHLAAAADALQGEGTFGELSLSDRGSRIRYEMEQLHDRVMRVRNVIPPEPPGKPWWKFWT